MSELIKHKAIESYALRLADALREFDWSTVNGLANDILECWIRRSHIWIMGNGGSSANAVHWANDFLYPIAKGGAKHGIRIHALTANPAVVTCLGNDIGYDQIFSHQLNSQASPGDLVIALSGSGNSPNILNALSTARGLGVKSYAIVGFNGGKAKGLADVAIHFAVDDMQVAEDAQMVVCHAVIQSLVEAPGRPV